MWATETIESLVHLLGAISWGLALLLLLLTPGLLGLIVKSYRHSRTEDILGYISKYVPMPIFSVSIFLIHILCLSVIGLQCGLEYGYWTPLVQAHLGSYALLISGSFVVIGLFYRATYQIWSYLYMPKEQALYLKQDYFVISMLRTGVLLLMQLLILTPIPLSIYLWILGISIGLLQLLRSMQTIRRLSSKGESLHFYIFLYLCAHELLPWLCIVQLISYWIKAK